MSKFLSSQLPAGLLRAEIIATPLPLATASYAPVPHGIVINTVLEGLDKAGIVVLSEDYSTNMDCKQVKGRYQLQHGDSEMNLSLIFHNSYNKTMPLRIAIGGHIIVCENGMVIGDMGAFKRRHTGTVLQEFIDQMQGHIAKAGETFLRLQYQRDRMKEIEMTKRTTSELMGRLFLEEALITNTQLMIIKREIENPSFNYGVEGTLWNSFNNVTVALKEAQPSTYLKQHIEINDFLVKEFDLV